MLRTKRLCCCCIVAVLILNGILMDFWRRYGNTWIWLGYTQNLKGWTQIMRILLSYHLRRKPWKISATESTRTWSNNLNSECHIIMLLLSHLNGIFWSAMYQIIFYLFFWPSSLTAPKIAALWYGVPVWNISLRELARYALDQQDVTLLHTHWLLGSLHWFIVLSCRSMSLTMRTSFRSLRKYRRIMWWNKTCFFWKTGSVEDFVE